jgi:hypothetical protein
MLKAIATLNRKITRDYNSTGYGITLEGEIPAGVGEPELVLGKVHELFALAEEALAQEIERDQGEDAIGRRDEPPAPRNGHGQTSPPPSSNGNTTTRPQNGDGITPKQVKFVMTLSQRQRLSANQLASRIEQAIGRSSDVNGLTKREAGQVIDTLSQDDKSHRAEQAGGRGF